MSEVYIFALQVKPQASAEWKIWCPNKKTVRNGKL